MLPIEATDHKPLPIKLHLTLKTEVPKFHFQYNLFRYDLRNESYVSNETLCSDLQRLIF